LKIERSGDRSLRVWSLEPPILERILLGHARPLTGVALLPDAEWAVTSSQDGSIQVWPRQWLADARAVRPREEPRAGVQQRQRTA
jgi:WD40 repeat protein